MAEAIARCDVSDVIEAFSAGLSPLGFVAEMTEQTLIKNGYWVRGLKSKGIKPEVWNQADIVINMSGRQRELAFSDCSNVEDWEIEDPYDPYGAHSEVYQQVFGKILKRVEELADRCRRKQQAVRTLERRARTRIEPSSPIFINADDLNGGVVLNISEDGLAFLWDMDLSGGPLLTMRIQFPGPGNWVETSGQIVWKSEPKKEAGIRFVGLTAEAQVQIKNWISSQVSEAESLAERETSPAPPNEQDALPQTSLDDIPEENTEFATPQRQVALADDLDREGSPPSISNRRVHFRKRLVPPIYISLENNTGGVVLDVSEGGLSLAAARALPDAPFLNMRFQIPYCSGWVEAKGQIAWRSDSGEEAGVTFVALSDEAREQIRKWIHSKVSPSRLQEQLEKVRQAQNLRVARLIRRPQGQSEVAQEDWLAEPFLPDPVSSRQEVKLADTAPRATKPAGISLAKGVLKARLGAKNLRRSWPQQM